MKSNRILLLATLLAGISSPSRAATLLLSDDFNEAAANESAATFNDNLADTQGGTLATINYTVGSGSTNAAQHSNGGSKMTLATFPDPDGRGFGRVSLDNNFATQANAANQPLQISFNLVSVFGYASDTTRWVSFSIGSAQNQFITDDYVGILFRASGGTQTLNGGTQLGTDPQQLAWTANDLVTITLSGTGGVGSAFSTNGTEAKIQVGANTLGSFDLPAQQTTAFLTFSAYNDISSGTAVFGGGEFDNLNIQIIPEPHTALLGGLGLLALLRRRRA